MTQRTRPLRADAARNRARILEVAYETFARDGLAVPIDEIARRAGVGAGTVYRHFPTKEALFAAMATERVRHLIDCAAPFTGTEQPGQAFLGYLAVLVDESRTDQGLAEAMAGIGFDIVAAIPAEESRFTATIDGLLTRAQLAGAIRADVGVREVKALLVGCHAMQRYSGDPDAARRTFAVVRDGLRAAPGTGS